MSEDLIEAIGGYHKDPLGFVCFAYPWGQKGTPLEDELGPDAWQVDILTEIRSKLDINLAGAIQIAVASGHGIGKTALVSWIVHWFISTRPNCQVVVTANTENQLNTKTWRELAKWHKLSIHRDWFNWTATKFYQVGNPETWFAAAIPWSEEKPESFAGTHEKDVLVIFDEASTIADIIWETTEGAMTTPGAMWFAFGNPTKNTGRFRECWGKFKHRWKTLQIDSRKAKKTDKGQIQQWVDDYGEDSDFVRVRVRGVFPRAGSQQFIGQDIIDCCRNYKAVGYESQPKTLGVDIARFGDDQTVLMCRQGRKADPAKKFRGLDTMEVANLVIDQDREFDYDLIFLDGNGVGGGVIDRLRQLGLGHKIIDVNGGGKPTESDKYNRQRDEMWGRMKEWLKAGAEIPDDNELVDDLTGPEYGYTPKLQIQLESKRDMKKRGLASPDIADALALTFSQGIVLPDRRPRDRYKKYQKKYQETSWMAR